MILPIWSSEAPSEGPSEGPPVLRFLFFLFLAAALEAASPTAAWEMSSSAASMNLLTCMDSRMIRFASRFDTPFPTSNSVSSSALLSFVVAHPLPSLIFSTSFANSESPSSSPAGVAGPAGSLARPTGLTG